ncbi:hypothetical protein [Streptomyces sp. NBC_00009]|uniref:hypothetical protein n=1 Tax=Streptomyces sp. NBC_00009 TaxID=2975620 RepID=UPI003862E7BD
MDDAGAIAVSRLWEELLTRHLLPDQPVGLTERVADKVQLPALRAGRGADPHVTPRVGSGFESRRPGLFLAGLMTAADFGPSMRFVHGASFTAPHLVAGVVRRLCGGRPSGGLTLPGSRSVHDPSATADR